MSLKDVYYQSNASKITEEWMKSYPSFTESQSDIKELQYSSLGNTKNFKTREEEELEKRLLNKKKRNKDKAITSEDNNKINNNNEDSDIDEVSKIHLVKTKKSKIDSVNSSKQMNTSSNIEINRTNENKSIPNNANTMNNNDIEKPIPLKRKKTRSKQKNVRKDNRANDQKPIHLQIGTKEYRGRPLTEATKKILAIDVKKDKKNTQD